MKQNKVIKLIVLITVFLALGGCSAEQERGMVARVDNHTISQEDFDREFQVYKDLYERQLGEGALEQEGIDGKTMGESLEESILEKLITEKLVEDDSQDKDIVVTDEEVQENIDDYKETIGGEESYEQFLQSNSLSEEYFVANMEKELLVEKHKVDYITKVDVSEEEARSYYESNSQDLIEINASHILLGSEEEAQEVILRLEEGEGFAELAREVSLDSVSAVNGGNLGYFEKGQMIPEFEEVAFELEEDETSGAVSTEVGYHIIKVQDRRESFEDLKSKIITIIKEQAYYDYIQSLRDQATVEIFLD